MSSSAERRATLLDQRAQEQFARDGYAVVDFAPPGVVHAFATRFQEFYVGDRAGFHSSLESSDFEYRQVLHDELVASFGPLVDHHFDDHVIAMAQATVKWASADSTVRVHQDWTLVDERHFRSINLWIPLVDTNAENGGLYVLPGSQHEFDRLRPNGGFPSWYFDRASELDPGEFVPVHVSAGQAIVTDHAVLHHSPPNRTGAPRVAVVLALIPREAELFHLVLRPDDSIVRYTLEDPSFFRQVVAYEDVSHLVGGLRAETVAFEAPGPAPSSVSPVEAPPPRREPFWRHVGRRARARIVRG